MSLTLIIGNKNYSSWSMRPWMVMKEFAIPFQETVVPLYRQQSKTALLAHSPAGKAPILVHDEFAIWDSLAIIDYLAELFPDRAIWPRDQKARGRARSLSCEMHSGFASLRAECPMNFRRAPSATVPSEALLADLSRLERAWIDARRSYGAGGRFLFGAFTGADAMFAPVVRRLEAYELPVSQEARSYLDAVKALPSWAEWAAAAQTEEWVIERFEI